MNARDKNWICYQWLGFTVVLVAVVFFAESSGFPIKALWETESERNARLWQQCAKKLGLSPDGPEVYRIGWEDRVRCFGSTTPSVLF